MNNLEKRYKKLEEIDRELTGEQLLFKETDVYTEEEKALMKNAVYRRIEKSINYQYLAYGYFNKLVSVCGLDAFNLNDYTDSSIFGFAHHETSKITPKELEDIYDWSIYTICETYGYTAGQYPKMITSAIIPVKKMEEIYTEGNIFKYNSDVNFMVTNNFLITRYPEFFDEKIIETLKLVVSSYDKDVFSSKKDLRRFKKARKVLFYNIDKYENKNSKKKAKKMNVDIIRYKM